MMDDGSGNAAGSVRGLIIGGIDTFLNPSPLAGEGGRWRPGEG